MIVRRVEGPRGGCLVRREPDKGDYAANFRLSSPRSVREVSVQAASKDWKISPHSTNSNIDSDYARWELQESPRLGPRTFSPLRQAACRESGFDSRPAQTSCARFRSVPRVFSRSLDRTIAPRLVWPGLVWPTGGIRPERLIARLSVSQCARSRSCT